MVLLLYCYCIELAITERSSGTPELRSQQKVDVTSARIFNQFVLNPKAWAHSGLIQIGSESVQKLRRPFAGTVALRWANSQPGPPVDAVHYQ